MTSDPLGEKTRPCPLCGYSAGFELSRDVQDYYRCGRCDLTFVPKDQQLAPEEEKYRYSQHNNTIDNEGYVNMFTRNFPILEQYCPEVKTVLDYGCGPGPVLVELLNREGYTASGYDPYFAANTDLTGPYDLVISTEAFEHFANPKNELLQICQTLAPGGYLAIMTRQRTAETDLRTWWYVRDPTHVAFYSPLTFEWIGTSFGFQIVYQNYVDFVVMHRTHSV